MQDDNGFLTIEIIIAFSLFILFTISAFTLDTTMKQLKVWSTNRLVYIKDSAEKLYTSTTTIKYGNDSRIVSSGPFSITQSDYINAWGQSSCSPRITFDKNKLTLNTTGINLGTGNMSTDIDARDSTAYLTANGSNQAQPDFYMVDTTQTRPTIISSLNTGPGLSALALATPYIYVANQSTISQMQVIDIHARGVPKVVGEVKLPLPEASTTPSIGKSIFYRNGYVYLGTAKWDGAELYIINVSNPKVPTIVGSFETNTLINDIYVIGDRAYLATSDEYQMRVLDISNKNNPQLLYTFSPSGWQTQEGKTLNYFEDVLSLGRTVGGFNVVTNHEAFIFSSSSPQNIAYSADIPGGVYGILNRNPYIYILTHTVGSEFQVFTSDLKTKVHTMSVSTSSPVAMACDRSTIYFATGDSKGLSTLKIQ
jgi:uncharacterized secreted protein with C-terminal beta-propeller domain